MKADGIAMPLEELAEVRPVDLRLLARHRPQPLESPRRFSRAKAADEAPEMIGPAGVAALFDHDEQPARAEARVLLELLDDEGDVRVDHRWPAVISGAEDDVGERVAGVTV